MFCKSIGVIMLVLIVGTLFLFGCGRHRGFHRFHEKKMKWALKKLSKELSLNSEQKVKLESILNEVQSKKDSMRSIHNDLYNAVIIQVENDSLDQALLNQTFEENESKLKEMRVLMVTQFAEFHKMLMPEQRSKLKEKLGKLHEHCCR